jgi:hypothetical protein
MQIADYLLGQSGSDSAVNQWLADNPFMLGVIFIVIGGALAAYGFFELRSGVARDKYGNEIGGGLGRGLAIMRVVIGLGCAGFAIYKMVAG